MVGGEEGWRIGRWKMGRVVGDGRRDDDGAGVLMLDLTAS
jgi:hypothetical protein